MAYFTTLTKKGQITIPKELRGMLSLKTPSKVILEIEEGKKTIKITPPLDILNLAGKLKPRKGKSAVKARDILEKHYQRL